MRQISQQIVVALRADAVFENFGPEKVFNVFSRAGRLFFSVFSHSTIHFYFIVLVEYFDGFFFLFLFTSLSGAEV